MPTSPPGARPARSPRTAHRHFDLNVRVAWMYFRDEMSQQEIAEVLGISRSSVSNYLAAAKAQGVYSIGFDPRVIADTALAQALRDRFGLRDAYIVPSHGTPEQIRRRVGSAGALCLSQALPGVRRLGVCWGETVLDVGDTLAAERCEVTEVYQMVGIARTSFWALAEACNMRIAQKLGANVFQFPAPGRVSSEALYRMLIHERIVAEQFAALRSLDAAIFGTCSLEPGTLILSSGLMPPEAATAATAQGAEGIIGGRAFDLMGAPVRVPEYDDRLLALDLDEVRAIPVRLLVAGGVKKHRAIHGALQGGYASALATDVETAEAVLALRP